MMQSIALSEYTYPAEDEYVMVTALQAEEPFLMSMNDEDETADDASYDYCEEFDFSSKTASGPIVIPTFTLPPQLTDTDVDEAVEALQTDDFAPLEISQVVQDNEEPEKKPAKNKPQSDSSRKLLPHSILTSQPEDTISVVSTLSATTSVASDLANKNNSKLSRLSNKKRRKQNKLAKKAAAATAAATAFAQLRIASRNSAASSKPKKMAPPRLSKRGQVAPAVAYARQSIQIYKDEVAAANRSLNIR
jgi:hypothetical protein